MSAVADIALGLLVLAGACTLLELVARLIRRKAGL